MPSCSRLRERRLATGETSADARLGGRVLAIVSGSLRGAPVSWESLHTNLLANQRAALLLVIAEPMAMALQTAAAAAAARPVSGAAGLTSPHATQSSEYPAALRTAEAAAHFHQHLGRHALHIVSVPEYDDYGEALDLIARSRLSDGEAYDTASPTIPWRERPVDCPGAWWVASPLGGVRNATCLRAASVQQQRQPQQPMPPGQPRSAVAHHAEREPLKSTGSAAIVGVYRWYAKRALLERGLLDAYDWFIYTRTDLHILCVPALPRGDVLQLALKEARKLQQRRGWQSGGNGGVAIVPDGEDWGGLMERLVVASGRAILPALTTLEHWVLGRAKLAHNSETQLRWSLRRACVPVLRVPRTAFVVQRVADDGARRRRRQRGSRRADALPAFERARSNWGGCMHAASHIDVHAFGMPVRWGLRPVAVPSEMAAAGVCPKYAAGWWLANRTCTARRRLQAG